MNGCDSLSYEDNLCRYFDIFWLIFKIHIWEQIKERLTWLPVDYRTHETHYPPNVVQIGTQKKLKVVGEFID